MNIQEIIVRTGQYYDVNMSDVFFEEMHISKPEFFLGVGGMTHGAMIDQMIKKIEEVLVKVKLALYGSGLASKKIVECLCR